VLSIAYVPHAGNALVTRTSSDGESTAIAFIANRARVIPIGRYSGLVRHGYLGIVTAVAWIMRPG